MGEGRYQLSYNGTIFEDLKLRREEEGRGGIKGAIYTAGNQVT